MASNAVVGSKANAAYDRKITGAGVTIAVIDSGIDLENAEFAGRISDKSKSFPVGYVLCGTCAPEAPVTFELNDVQGHGTIVASVAAGAANGKGSHGIAYDAQIMALKIASPDLDPVTTPLKERGLNASAIAPAIRYAVDNGAFVMNLSAAGSIGGANGIADLRSAMDHVRANDRLFVQAVTNNVSGSMIPADSFAPGQFANIMVGSDMTNAGWFLFAIRIDADGKPPEVKGHPGALANRTLAVMASPSLVTSTDGSFVFADGNSLAAPAVAGAAALLKQNWPQLGGRTISEILLTTATDMGAPGVDQIYGVGLMNIEKAFQADPSQVQFSSIPGSTISASSITVSGAFGGATTSSLFADKAGKAVVLDNFGRTSPSTSEHSPPANARAASASRASPSRTRRNMPSLRPTSCGR